MRSLIASMLSLAFMALVALSDAPADGKKNDGVITNWGEPKAFEPGKFNSYWLWHDDGVWHFRTTGGGKGTPRFEGRIEVAGGKFVQIKGKRGEYKGKTVDSYIYNKAMNVLAFDFKTDEKADGLNFAVDGGAKALKFTLAINGEAEPKHVRIGKEGDHPAEAVFVVPAHPPAPRDDNEKGKEKGKGKKK